MIKYKSVYSCFFTTDTYIFIIVALFSFQNEVDASYKIRQHTEKYTAATISIFKIMKLL